MCSFDKTLLAFALLHFVPHGQTCQSMDLVYSDVEWFALEMNHDHSVSFEIAPKYCILDFFFIDYEGFSISSNGFLPTVVDIMVI